jgi:hypothetical protein
MLPHVALYGFILGFSRVAPHNHVSWYAGSDQRSNSLAQPCYGFFGGHSIPLDPSRTRT